MRKQFMLFKYYMLLGARRRIREAAFITYLCKEAG